MTRADRWLRFGRGDERYALVPISEATADERERAVDPGTAARLLEDLLWTSALGGDSDLRRYLPELCRALGDPAVDVYRLPTDELVDLIARAAVERRLLVVTPGAPERPQAGGGGMPELPAPPEPEPPRPRPAPEPKPKKLEWLEVELVAEDGDEPLSSRKFAVKLTDGTAEEGELDSQGRLRFDDIPPGTCSVTFPDSPSADAG
jgi:hypothetical protein